MRNSRMKVVGVLFVSALALTGCGEAIYTMTPEEEAAIVSYAAHTLSKFNTYQNDGEVYVPDSPETEEEIGEQELDGAEPSMDADAAPPDIEGAEAGEAGLSGEGGDQTPGEAPTDTLNQALDLGPIQADCVAKEFAKSYLDSDTMALDAEAGTQFLVLHINLTNQSDQDLHVNILSMTPTFVIHMDSSVKTPARTTILLNDLGTFQGDIAAGGVAETVLLFQVPEDITEASSVQLEVTMDGNHFTVNL